MQECDNISRCHTPKTIVDTDVLIVICETCKHQYVIRKDPNTGAPEKRTYAKIFKKDVLQGSDNLFYKYYPQYLRQ